MGPRRAGLAGPWPAGLAGPGREGLTSLIIKTIFFKKNLTPFILLKILMHQLNYTYI